MPFIEMTCWFPGVPENGVILGQAQFPARVGSAIFFGCQTSYEMSGPSTRLCEADGQWSDSMPSCSKITEGMFTNA